MEREGERQALLPRCFAGSALKWLAICVMLLDHVGASLLEVFVLDVWGNSPLAGAGISWSTWYGIDQILRRIGRSAFPIFCFLIAEGAVHTKNPRKYLLRLLAFAALSEVPFDLALHNQVLYLGAQNVFFTLALGLGTILLFRRFPGEGWKGCLALVLSCAAAEFLSTDYGAIGVAVIVCLYLLRDRRVLGCLVALLLLAILNPIELWGLPGFLAILLYDGRRGRQPKYFFYAFYPAHLLLLWAVGNCLLPAVLLGKH